MMTSARDTFVDVAPARSRADPLGPSLVACAVCLILAGWLLARVTDGLSAWTFEAQRIASAARGERSARPIVLRDPAGRPFTAFGRDAAANDVWLVDFIYTRCASVCQALGSEYFRMQEQLAASGADPAGSGSAAGASTRPGRVHLLSVSMDPARDGSTELSDHARLHRADGQRWRVAAPVDATEGARLQRDLGVVVVPDGFGGFVHNAGIHLIDGQGRLRAIRDLDQWEDALATARRMTQAAP